MLGTLVATGAGLPFSRGPASQGSVPGNPKVVKRDRGRVEVQREVALGHTGGVGTKGQSSDILAECVFRLEKGVP